MDLPEFFTAGPTLRFAPRISLTTPERGTLISVRRRRAFYMDRNHVGTHLTTRSSGPLPPQPSGRNIARDTPQARDRLEQFVIWCDENDYDNLNDLTDRRLIEYREWRGQDIKPITVRKIQLRSPLVLSGTTEGVLNAVPGNFVLFTCLHRFDSL